MKAFLKKLSKLLSISLSLAIILTVLPMNTIHVHAADTPYIYFYPSDFSTKSGKNLTSSTKNNMYIRLYNSKANIQVGSYNFTFPNNNNTSIVYGVYTSNGMNYWDFCSQIYAYTTQGTIVIPFDTNANLGSNGSVSSFGMYKHTLVKKAAQAATCTADGWKEYWECSRCGDVYTTSTPATPRYRNAAEWKSGDGKIAAKGAHNFNSKTQTADYLKSSATCESPAVYYYKCATCAEKGTATYTVGTALGHNYRETWTYDGTNHWYQCERCLHRKDEAEHIGGTATCIQLAVCETCGKEYGDFGSHNLEHKNAQAANCMQDGWKEYWECSTPDCGAVFANADGTGTKYTETSWKDGAGKVAKNNNHDWSYVVNGNTITATCSRNTTDHTASISVSTLNHTYDGLSYSRASLSNWSNSSFNLGTPTITYVGRNTTIYTESTTAPKDAGEYSAQITIGEVTASADFTISPLPVTLTWDNTELIYNGTAQKPTATVNEKVGNDVVEVVVTGEQTNANASGETYTATADHLEGADASNYTLPATKPTHSFTIEPKPIELLTDVSVLCGDTNTPAWTGSNFTPAVVIKDGTYTLQSTDYTLSGDLTNKHIGIYEITATGQGNYKGHKNLGWKILPAQHAEGTVYGTAYVGTYNGLDYDNDEGTKYHQISVTAPDNSTIYYYAPDKDGHPVGEHVENIPDTKYSATNPTFVDAGNHIVYFKVVTEGYDPVYDHSVVAIGQRVVKLSWANTNSLVYVNSTTRQAPTPTITNKVGNDDVSVKDVLGGEIFAGEYTAIADTLQGTRASNYIIDASSENRTVSYTIAKQPVTAPAENEANFVYDGQAQTYTLAANSLYEILNNTHTDADTYKVYVNLLDDANYMWSDGTVANKEYTFTIDKKQITAPTTGDITFVYDGTEKTISFTPHTTGDDALYEITNNAHTNAGTYEVDVALTNSKNYKWSDTLASDNKTFTLTINKKEILAPTPGDSTVTYDGTEKTLTFTPKADGDDELYTVSNNKHTNAGTYKVDVVLDDNNNYKWSGTTNDYVEYTFTINKRSVTIPTQDSTVFTYDGSEKVYTLATSNLYDILNNKHYNAGEYTVSAVLKNTENNKWSDDTIANKTFTFTINKAKVDIPAADPIQTTPGFTFNRTVQTYAIEPSELYSVSNNRQTNAGTHTVTVALIDKNNYEWNDAEASTSEQKVADKTYPFTINPLDISNTATIALDPEYYEFTGLEKEAHISFVTDGEVGIFDGVDFDLSGNKATVPGTHTLTATFKGNYTGSKSIDWLIVEDIQHTQKVELPEEDNYVGELELVVTGDKDVPRIDLANPIHLLDEEDLDKLKEGKREIPNGQDSTYYYVINLILSLNEKTEDGVDPASLEAIKNVANGPTGSHYYDISVTKVTKKIEIAKPTAPETEPVETVKDTTIKVITSTSDPIVITIDIPEEIPTLKSGYNRKYSIIRSHKIGGTVDEPIYEAIALDTEYLKPTEENPTGTVTFTSDQFSDYVLTYKDTLIPRSYKAPNTSVR